MKSFIEKLNEYFEKGLLYKQLHPTLPLIIWNYSETVQYEGCWNDILLMCRGLVTDTEGNIIARPFKKFFNIEENKHTPTQDFEVYEKLDGSLGILFYYNGQWIIATRGSFVSDQAIKATELLKNYDTTELLESYTFLFEIIYPQNRIVCQYDYEGLVLLGVIHNQNGREMDYKELGWFSYICGYPLVKRYNGITDYTTLKNIIKDNEEGFVVRFSNGDRCKIKGEEYIRLHRIMTNCSTTSIWEVLKNGDSIDSLLKDVPDEFYKKIHNYIDELNSKFNEIKNEAILYFNEMYPQRDSLPLRKDYAMWVKLQSLHLHHILFKMYDNNDYDDYIWKLIRPEFEKL
jgi:RNA ligase